VLDRVSNIKPMYLIARIVLLRTADRPAPGDDISSNLGPNPLQQPRNLSILSTPIKQRFSKRSKRNRNRDPNLRHPHRSVREPASSIALQKRKQRTLGNVSDGSLKAGRDGTCIVRKQCARLRNKTRTPRFYQQRHPRCESQSMEATPRRPELRTQARPTDAGERNR
jgi:hypothetical protein